MSHLSWDCRKHSRAVYLQSYKHDHSTSHRLHIEQVSYVFINTLIVKYILSNCNLSFLHDNRIASRCRKDTANTTGLHAIMCQYCSPAGQEALEEFSHPLGWCQFGKQCTEKRMHFFKVFPQRNSSFLQLFFFFKEKVYWCFVSTERTTVFFKEFLITKSNQSQEGEKGNLE